MRPLLLILFVLTFPVTVMAQETHMIRQREWSAQIQHLAEINGELSIRAAVAESRFDMEKADREMTDKQLAETQAYWKAWCGDRSGCATPEAKDAESH